MENVIEIKGLVKTYKKIRAVDNLDLDVKKGSILGLLGPNGSGKSTTINCLLALIKKDSGSIKIYGKEMTPESYDIKKKIGVVFQDVGVYEELNVYENIDYFCGLYIKDKDKRKQLIEETIDLVGLNEFLKFRPKELSGGLLRRLNIACGIAHEPDIIIFDEPTVAVDPQSRNNILEGIKKLNKNGATIIYTSHYMDEVEELCDYIVIIDRGKVIAEGSSDSLKAMIDTKEKISFRSENLDNEIIEKIKSIDSLLEMDFRNDTYHLSFANGKDNLIKLINILNENSINYDSLTSQSPSLNDVFLSLTGKGLRD
ncbi:MAG: ABC transporter ATP-binding protein [Anaerococcus sp.]|uniref:ABC transporter ATP-binding protein n=1 Tax=Anaerococcus nagyae TaxID=1755241 RepID=A0A3E2TJ87_9FIRM|nr:MULTISPECIES: ABC transporter ATP-binding protein [Anaerococcus]MBP2070355.1 ABC-2 type transport system ATP-binding protein [Anaerococcus nagyae]MDU2353091.1 ABC transporter ATP-binding protein [Anaerococcus sp.]MDU2566190.1 ABC transporter ATP-binding protein [Anaerococcus sp.]RGB77070.1 ABC transporter ATP-binding protein [Anaerococcus nagyae]